MIQFLRLQQGAIVPSEIQSAGFAGRDEWVDASCELEHRSRIRRLLAIIVPNELQLFNERNKRT